MKLKVNIRPHDSVNIVDLEGMLDTNTTPAAEEKVNALLEGGGRKLLFNLEKLDYVSSTGLRLILTTAKRLRGNGGDIRLCGLNQMVRDLFEMTGIMVILNVFESETEALAGF